MCTVLLQSGGYPTAVNKYIIQIYTVSLRFHFVAVVTVTAVTSAVLLVVYRMKPFEQRKYCDMVREPNGRFFGKRKMREILKVINNHIPGSVAYRGGGVQTHPPPRPRNFEGFPKSCQTQPDCENC